MDGNYISRMGPPQVKNHLTLYVCTYLRTDMGAKPYADETNIHIQISFFFTMRDPVHPLQRVPQKGFGGTWHRLWYGPQYPLL